MEIQTVEDHKRSLPAPEHKRRYLDSLNGYNLIAESMLLNKRQLQGNIFLITSPGNDEGKSTITALLGQLFTSRGKNVLLIEANLRKPSFAARLGVKKYKGLWDYFAGDAEIQEIIKNLNGIHLIFAGTKESAQSRDAFDVLYSEKMKALLEHAKKEYDFIFIDTPCIKKFNDALALSPLSDGVILVVEANQTPRRSIDMCTEKIRAAGGHVKGIILNKRTNFVPEILQDIIY